LKFLKYSKTCFNKDISWLFFETYFILSTTSY